MEGDCHLPAFCRSVSSVPAWSAAARTCPVDLSVGDPEDRGLRVKVGRPEGQQVFERRTSRRAPPGAGGLEGDVLPPEISRFGAAERPVPEHSADRHVDAPSPVGRLGGPQGLRVQRLRLALRPGVGPGQPGQSLLASAWAATSSSPARRWAAEIPSELHRRLRHLVVDEDSSVTAKVIEMIQEGLERRGR